MRPSLLIFLFLAATPAAARQDARPVLGQALGAVLQADGPRARALLEGLPSDGLTPGQSDLRACVLQRLDPAAPPIEREADSAFSLRALDAYRLYWRDAANAPDARAEAETALAGRLSALLDRPDLQDMPTVEPVVLERIRAEGYHALGGRTGRLLELMLWGRQDRREVAVDLPEGRHVTPVFYLDAFESRGWSNWLTCGRSGTGGWAKPEGLHALVPAYDSLDDETFRVNFLAHETQHFADNAAWPGLPGWELEFRAKLTELVMAEATLRATLGAFASNQGDDAADAHSYANRRVLTALRRRLALADDADLTTSPADDLREAARRELFADTARRKAAAP